MVFKLCVTNGYFYACMFLWYYLINTMKITNKINWYFLYDHTHEVYFKRQTGVRLWKCISHGTNSSRVEKTGMCFFFLVNQVCVSCLQLWHTNVNFRMKNYIIPVLHNCQKELRLINCWKEMIKWKILLLFFFTNIYYQDFLY